MQNIEFNQKDFDLFWSNYPLKKAKGQALKTWKKLLKNGELPKVDVLIKAIREQDVEKAYLIVEKKFCPPWKHPSTWLNAYGWEDEVYIPKQTGFRHTKTPIERFHENGEKRYNPKTGKEY